MTKNTRFALLLRPQASQSVRTPIKSREPVFIDAMLAARRRGFGKTRLRGCSLDGDYPPARHAQEIHGPEPEDRVRVARRSPDRKSTRLNSSHANISYAVFCLKKKK